MFGSAHDGEIAAGRRADAMVKAAGLTWDQMISPSAPIPVPPYRPPRCWHRPRSPSDAAALCLQWSEVLDDWEIGFCRSIIGRRWISAKEATVLARVIGKVEAFVRATGERA